MKRKSLAFAVAVLAAGTAWAKTSPEAVAYLDGAVADSLTGVACVPEDGVKVISTCSIGRSLASHQFAALPDVAFQGDPGLALEGADSRWDEAKLRGSVSNVRMKFEDSMMPSCYKTSGYILPGNDFTGKAGTEPLPPLLTAQQIEDVISYLLTLKE